MSVGAAVGVSVGREVAVDRTAVGVRIGVLEGRGVGEGGGGDDSDLQAMRIRARLVVSRMAIMLFIISSVWLSNLVL